MNPPKGWRKKLTRTVDEAYEVALALQDEKPDESVEDTLKRKPGMLDRYADDAPCVALRDLINGSDIQFGRIILDVDVPGSRTSDVKFSIGRSGFRSQRGYVRVSMGLVARKVVGAAHYSKSVFVPDSRAGDPSVLAEIFDALDDLEWLQTGSERLLS